MGGRGIERGLWKGGDTRIVSLLIPIRVTGDILGLLLMLLLAASLEHLLEELELGCCESEKGKEVDA